MADISLQILVSVQQATDAIKQFSNVAQDSLKKVEQQSSKTTEAVQKSAENTSFSMQSLATATGVVLANAFERAAEMAVEFAKDLVSESVKAAIEAEESVTKLSTALKLSGQFTEQNIDALTKQATALSAVTKYSDNQIVSMQAQIQTLGRLSGEGLGDATTATLDFAAAMGIDLASAATLVGKAAEGNVTAFQKLGVSIKKGSTDAETFANTIRALETRFAGAAESSGNTFSGALAKLTNAVDKSYESIGNLIVQNPAVVEGIKQLSIFASGLTSVIEENSAVIKSFIETGVLVMARAFEISIKVIQAFVSIIDGVAESFTLFSNVLIIASAEIILKILELGRGFLTLFGITSKGYNDMIQSVRDFSVAAEEGLQENLSRADQEIQARNKILNAVGDLANKGANATVAAIGKEEAIKDKAFQDDLTRISIQASKRQEELTQQITSAETARQENIKDIESLIARNAAIKALGDEKYLGEVEQNQTAIDAKLEQMRLFDETEIKFLVDKIAFLNTITTSDAGTQEARELKTYNDRLARLRRGSDEEIALKKKVSDAERVFMQSRLSAANTFFGNMASLMNTNSQALFNIGKVAALAQAIVNTAQAITLNLATYPGPIGIAIAASAAVAGAVQIATISAQHLATGITEVPQGFNNDSFPALLSSGERVLSVDQNKDLKAFISDQGSSRELFASIAEKIEAVMSRPIVVEVGGREVFRAVNDQLIGGRVFAT